MTYAKIARRYGCSTSAIDALANLDITPGKPAHPAAIKAVEEWAELEEQTQFAEVLAEDAKEIFMEKTNNTYVEETSLSDDGDDGDLESSNPIDSESGGVAGG